MDIQKEYATLMEAYNAVYENQEQLDENRAAMRDPEGYEAGQRRSQSSRERRMNDPHTGINSPAFAEFMRKQMGGGKPKPKDQKEEFDLFDYLLEYLVAEGYADTNKAALAIMANMSEEWKQSIVEEVLEEGEKPFPHEKVTRKQEALRSQGSAGLERRMKMGLAKRRAKEAEKTGVSQQDAGKGWYHGR